MAELRMFQQRREQLKATQEKRAAAASEVIQNDFQLEAAAARVKALGEELREAEMECKALERRRQNYRCVAPMSGEVSEANTVVGEYVRVGDTIGRIRSLRRLVRLNLPASLADRLPVLTFGLAGRDRAAVTAFRLAAAGAEYNLNGGRSVALEVPEELEGELAVGKTVQVEVEAEAP
jgi:multidrug efflux pump subunit AcrA (membrane-fusion protein)